MKRLFKTLLLFNRYKKSVQKRTDFFDNSFFNAVPDKPLATRNKPHNNQLCADLSRFISAYSVVSHFLRFAWQTTVIERAVRDHSLQVDVDKLKNRSDLLSQAIIKCQSVSDIDTLRGIEGESAQLYFSVFDEFILQQKDEFRFVTRSKRPPLDNVNALLSFSYSVATGMCTSALETAGLDPYVGFMHTDRPGRRSLALDLVEEFRAIMCDRFVISLINKRIINNGDFEKREDGAVLLSEDGRKVFLTHWQNRKQDVVMHPFLKEKVEWGLLPYIQALLLSRYIRGDLDEYPMLLWR